jgi:hypothetical protein
MGELRMSEHTRIINRELNMTQNAGANDRTKELREKVEFNELRELRPRLAQLKKE